MRLTLGHLILFGSFSAISSAAAAEVAPKTFFRDGIWAPVYGDLGFNAASIGGVEVTQDHLKVGIQVLRLADFSLTGGYGMVGVSGGPWQKQDAPKKFRTHFHGWVAELHFVPKFFLQGSISYSGMQGSAHYEDTTAPSDERNVSHKGTMTDIMANINVKVWTDVYVNIGYGSRTSKLNGEDINLEMGEQSSSLLVVGVRGSTL